MPCLTALGPRTHSRGWWPITGRNQEGEVTLLSRQGLLHSRLRKISGQHRFEIGGNMNSSG